MGRYNIKMYLQEVEWEGTDFIELLRVTGACECENEISGSIKCWVFLDQLRTWQTLKKDCASQR